MNNNRGLFVAGTGTDIGKTFVTALIVKKLREAGLNAGYYKSALSGAETVNGKLMAGDAEYVREVAGLRTDANSLVSYIFETAVSPHLAALIEHDPIEMDKLASDFDMIKTRFDFITVEGSGGIVCPLRLDAKTIMLTDVIKMLGLDIIVVASARLGTINGIVLTVEHAKSKDIEVKGIILNGYESGNFMHIDNKKQAAALTGVPVIACVPPDATDLEIDAATLMGLYKEI